MVHFLIFAQYYHNRSGNPIIHLERLRDDLQPALPEER